ncbi:NYN domain-containing protein [Thauera linaloolentis]|uniref:HTH OST-type domain-containing protein n=1 Tax=Thauera linaloolentis (strain DSM 12138 / JCM 21573 / CCUG 41526 / CIP 105981 / IAM 15112 / NBRC 102519 / 47Lol) TaxID=1123367 RepID=N6Z669_THAL4|nr:NYN domain-containing protein [Thauera linaloolentis]ENO90037.1 hypothetical protein C666_03200 [Thauera linaloolentis 47Lol = DSM 12138]MCM8565321.1 NYN domain-containing protein [Thauera linaloolentis]
MASSADSISMALFCDFENVALGVRDANYEKFDIKRVLERLLLKGSIVVKKAYCDWDRYKSFKASMHEANFELIEIPHVRQSGKNSADIRLVVDALDLCYTKSHVDTFVIISGDSDFSPLVSKLRENAKQVIGVGVKQSTSDLLIANCDEFIFYDDLVRDGQRAAKRDARDTQAPSKRTPEEEKRRKEELEDRRGKAIEIAVETFDALMSERGDSGKIWASMLKEAIKRRKPDFNESYFGFRAFGNLLDEAQARGLLVVGRDEKSGTYVYRPNAAIVVAALEPDLPADGRSAQTEFGLEAGVGEVAESEVAPADGGRTSGRKNGRGRGTGGRKAKSGDTGPAHGEPDAAIPAAVPAEVVAAQTASEPIVPTEPSALEPAPAPEAKPAERRPAASSTGRGRSSQRGRKAEAGAEVAGAEQAPVQPEAPPAIVEAQAAEPIGGEAEAAPKARKPAARRRTRKPTEAVDDTGGEGA